MCQKFKKGIIREYDLQPQTLEFRGVIIKQTLGLRILRDSVVIRLYLNVT